MTDEITGSPPLARTGDPVTSHEAAASFDTTSLEFLVLGVIKLSGRYGCIGDDVVRSLPLLGIQTVSPRYAPLERKGFIFRKGDKRKAKSGRSQLVMRAARYRHEP